MTATLAIPSARAATIAAVPQRRGSIQQPPGAQPAEQRQDAEGRQEEPDAVMSRRVRHGPQEHQERPVPGDQQADRLALAPGHRRRRVPATPMQQESDRRDQHRPDDRVVPGQRLLGRVVDGVEELDRDRDRPAAREVRVEEPLDAADRIAPPGRQEREQDHRPRSASAGEQALKAGRLRYQAAQARNGKGRNQPVSLVAAAQPEDQAEARPSRTTAPPPIGAGSRREPPPGRRRRSPAPRATSGRRHRRHNARGRTGSAGRPRSRRPGPPASSPIASRRSAKMAPAVKLKSRIGPRRARGRSAQDRGQDVAGQAEQGVERRMAVRLLPRERPEPAHDPAIEEELRPGVQLVGGPGGGDPVRLDQLLGRTVAIAPRSRAGRPARGTSPGAGPRGRGYIPRPRRWPGAARWPA